MANKRIDQLPINSDALKDSDLVPIWDTVNNKTEKVELGTLASFIDTAAFTGNTSGNCITNLYVSNLYGCSPIKINSDIEIRGTNGSATTITSSGITTQYLLADGERIGWQHVLNPLILDNNNDSTTARAIYGINVVTSATSANLACRLPKAKEGFSLTILNQSDKHIFVYPSADGGSINGLVDVPAILPPDNNNYLFSCYQNPLPGAWTFNSPSLGQYVLPEIIIPHTGGTSIGV